MKEITIKLILKIVLTAIFFFVVVVGFLNSKNTNAQTTGGVVTGTFVYLINPHFAGYITSKTADTGATGVNQIEYIEKVSRDLIFTY